MGLFIINFLFSNSLIDLTKLEFLALCETIIIEENFLLLKGFCINLLTDIWFFDKILVTDERTPVLSITSNLIYEEKNSSAMSKLLIFFLFLFGIENGNFIFPLSIEQISDTRADVVGPGPAPSPCIVNLPTGLPSTMIAFNTPFILKK